MPVTISAEHLALRIGILVDTAAPIPEYYQHAVDGYLAVCTDFAEGYAPNAPDAVQDEAVVVMAGHLFQAPPTQRTPANAFVNSGARSLLARHHEIASAVV